MNTISAGAVQNILEYLTPKDAGTLARTCWFMCDTVDDNKCTVIAQGIHFWNYLNGPGSHWEDVKHVTTKQRALDMIKAYQADPKVNSTAVFNDSWRICWEWSMEAS